VNRATIVTHKACAPKMYMYTTFGAGEYDLITISLLEMGY
jgi:hypothetical protein